MLAWLVSIERIDLPFSHVSHVAVTHPRPPGQPRPSAERGRTREGGLAGAAARPTAGPGPELPGPADCAVVGPEDNLRSRQERATGGTRDRWGEG